jgi:hypothetical protein
MKMVTFGQLTIFLDHHRVVKIPPLPPNVIVIAGIFAVFLYASFMSLDTNNVSVFVQAQESTNQTDNPFKILDDSDPVPSNREMILTDEILALGEDINSIKNASTSGDFETVFNKTLEVVEGPNWGNISADLLYRKDLVPLNNFVMALESLNSLSKNTTIHTQSVNDTIVRESNDLVTEYGKVLDALAVPIFDVPKIITNLIIPAIIVVIIIVAIPTIRRRYKIRY